MSSLTKYKNRKQQVGYKFKSRQLILNYNSIPSSLLSNQKSLGTHFLANPALTLLFVRVTAVIMDLELEQNILCQDDAHSKLSI